MIASDRNPTPTGGRGCSSHLFALVPVARAALSEANKSGNGTAAT